MAYKLHYKMKLHRNEGTEENPNIVEYFQSASVFATDADYDKQMAFAKAEAYNGEVTVEEVEDEYTPTQEERIASLEEQLTESDAVAMALYEASLEQQTVNAEQDAAILGLYEMIGG